MRYLVKSTNIFAVINVFIVGRVHYARKLDALALTCPAIITIGYMASVVC